MSLTRSHSVFLPSYRFIRGYMPGDESASYEVSLDEFSEVTSTQDLLNSYLDARSYGQRDDVYAMLARRQSAGRGRSGRSWDGHLENMYLSCAFPVHFDHVQAGQLGLVAAVALYETVQPYCADPDDLLLKWPNDLLFQGKKTAGILIETRHDPAQNSINWVTFGVGLNVLSAPDPAYACVSDMRAQPCEGRDILKLAIAFIENLAQELEAWNNGATTKLLKRWREYGPKPGTPVSVKHGDQLIEGLYIDIDDQGHLLIEQKDGIKRTLASGDVLFS